MCLLNLYFFKKENLFNNKSLYKGRDKVALCLIILEPTLSVSIYLEWLCCNFNVTMHYIHPELINYLCCIISILTW